MSASNHQGHAPLAGRAGRRPSFPLGAAVAGLAIALSLYSAAPSAEPVGQSPPSADDRPSDDISPAILLDELQSAAREKSERMERLRQELLRLSQWKARAESEAS